MPFIPAEDTYSVSIHQTYNGLPFATNVLYIGVASGVLTLTDCNNLVTAMAGVVNAAGIEADLNQLITWDETVFTDLTTEGGDQFVSTVVMAQGTNATAILPGQVSLVTTWRSANRTRNGRGRSFWSGLTEAASIGGIDAAVVTRWKAFSDGLIAALDTNAAPMQVVSRYNGMELQPGPMGQLLRRPIPRTLAQTNEIVSSDVQNQWRTQRRRAFQ